MDREDFDNVAWDRVDEAWERAKAHLKRKSTSRLVESIVKQAGRDATVVSPLIMGGYNILYRIHIEGKPTDVMVRAQMHRGPHLAAFQEEKSIREAATARYIGQQTQIPVPRLLSRGRHNDIGHFIIMDYVEHRRDLSDALTAPDHDIPEATLENLYGKVARCLLQLAQPSFLDIGSLAEAEDCVYSVAGRPLTQNMNNMIQLANVPGSALPPPGKTYPTANEWYVALAEMHMAQLIFQHNDLVSTADDCRNKYVARQLFRKLAKRGLLSTFGFLEDRWSAQSKTRNSTPALAPPGSGWFRLWCDDFRPHNILVDDADDIVAVVDWEFAYVGPTQFVLDPPWWLLLGVPEMWPFGIDDWSQQYEARLRVWLSAMKQAEDSLESNSLPFVLSEYMRESWETGRFWLNYAARKSWAFDTIFWKYLDERFFGDRGGDVAEQNLWKTRVHLLGENERRVMEPFVTRKMMESRQRILIDDWDPDVVKQRMSEVLFG